MPERPIGLIEQLIQEREAQAAPQRTPIRRPLRDPEEFGGDPGFFGTVADVAFGVPRGIEEAVRDVAGLGNILPGVDYELPDGRLFGRATTGAGEFSTGIFNFAAGFVPALGAVSKLAEVSGLAARVAGAGRAVQVGLEVAQGAVAGAVADFTVFDGNEARLSNLLQNFPLLQNPVTDFLAADADDPEVVGRLKNVLEGIGAGILTDTLLLGLRGLRAQRRALTEGKAPKAVEKAIADEAGGGEKTLIETLESVDPESPRVRDAEAELEAIAQQSSPRLEDPTNLGRAEGVAATRLGRGERSHRAFIKERLSISDERLKEAAEAFGGEEANRLFYRIATGIPKVPAVNPRALTDTQKAILGLEGHELNLSHMVATQGRAEAIRTIEAIFLPGPNVIPLKAQFQEGAERYADIVGGEPAEIAARLAVAALKEGYRDQAAVHRLMLIGQKNMLSYAQEYARAAREWKKTGDIEKLANSRLLSEEFVDLAGVVRDIKSEQGRGLGSNNLHAAAAKDAADIARVLRNAGGQKNLEKLTDRMLVAADQGGLQAAANMMRLSEMTYGRRAVLVIVEAFINSILSGARTLTVNVATPLSMSAIVPAEHMLGGVLTGNSPIIRRSLAELNGLAHSVSEAFRVAKKSLVLGENIYDPARALRDDPAYALGGTIRAETFGQESDTLTGQAINWLGRVIRLPTTLMRSSDEFVKVLNTRATLRADLMEEGISKGLRGEVLERHVVDGIEREVFTLQATTRRGLERLAREEAESLGITGGEALQRHIDEFIVKNQDRVPSESALRARSRAREVTFTETLRDGTISKSIQRIAGQHPILRIFGLPFIRTPVNIASQAGQRFDVAGATQTLIGTIFPKAAPNLAESRFRFARDLASGDPARRAEATGRLASGMGITALAVHYAAAGIITGGGPRDPEQRQVRLDAGWLPYSFRTPGGYVQYLRADPFATMLGTVADVYEYARLATQDEDLNIQMMGTGLMVGLAQNITNKTYLQGLRQIFDALSDPEAKMESVIQQYVGAFVPNTFAQAVLLSGDGNMRDVNSVLDKLKSRTPGFTDDLAPIRNVLGEPVKRVTALGAAPGEVSSILDAFLPIAYREVTDDVVRLEMGQLQHGFSPPKRVLRGVDLMDFRSQKGQTAYDRWLELHGSVKIKGRTLRQELRKLIKSSDYQRLSPLSTAEAESPRVDALTRVIRRFRRGALDQMFREFPEVRSAHDAAYRRLTQARAGIRSELLEERTSRTGVFPITGRLGQDQ